MVAEGEHDRLSAEEREEWRKFRSERIAAAKKVWEELLDRARVEADLAIEKLGTPQSEAHAEQASILTTEFKEALARFNEEIEMH